tara:strand:+ start:3169 stop:3651 length:483 start_codon:yes stop_codon:yes gene_type:complete
MTKKINKKLLLTLLILISLILVTAYLIEYQLNYQPCKLCIYERVPYIFSIFLIIKIFFFKGYEKATLLVLSLIFFASSILAFYHFGIEQGFFNESFVCNTGSFSENLSKEQLLEQLKQNTVSCKDVTFKIFGLSLAAINMIFSLFLSVIFARLFFNYENN